MYEVLFNRAYKHYLGICRRDNVEPAAVDQLRSHVERANPSTVVLRAIDGRALLTVYMEPEPDGVVWSAE